MSVPDQVKTIVSLTFFDEPDKRVEFNHWQYWYNLQPNPNQRAFDIGKVVSGVWGWRSVIHICRVMCFFFVVCLFFVCFISYLSICAGTQREIRFAYLSVCSRPAMLPTCLLFQIARVVKICKESLTILPTMLLPSLGAQNRWLRWAVVYQASPSLILTLTLLNGERWAGLVDEVSRWRTHVVAIS